MNILICGDSWGLGEFYVEQRFPPKFGTDYFLTILGHSVDNISVIGSANLHTYTALSKKNLDLYDYVFLFYTNPFRDLKWGKLYDHYFSCEPKTLSVSDYENIYHELVINFYTKLSQLNKTVYLIGGHNKLEDSINLPNLINFIPSVREFFYKDYTEEKIVYAKTVIGPVLDKFSPETIEYLYDSKKERDKLPLLQKKYFSKEPFHLDAEGHKELALFIEGMIAKRSF